MQRVALTLELEAFTVEEDPAAAEAIVGRVREAIYAFLEVGQYSEVALGVEGSSVRDDLLNSLLSMVDDGELYYRPIGDNVEATGSRPGLPAGEMVSDWPELRSERSAELAAAAG